VSDAELAGAEAPADEPVEPGALRNLRVTVAMVFVVFTGFAFVIPFLPIYVKELGIGDDEHAALWAGVLIAVAPLLAGLLAPVWGRLADRHGQKPMAVRALASYVVLLGLSAMAQDVWQLLALRCGVGLFGGIGPLGLAMATASLPRARTGQAVGRIQAAQILAAAVGPLTGGLLADTIGIRTTFWATAGLSALALLLVLRFYVEPERRASDTARQSAPFGAILRLAGVPSLLLALFLVNFVGRSFTPILPLQLSRLGVTPAALATTTGLLISIYSIAAASSATLLGRASRTRAPVRLLVASLAAGALATVPLAGAGSVQAFGVWATLLGLASGGALTLCYTIGGLMVPEVHRTTAFGFFSAAALAGGSASPVLAGWFVKHWSLGGVYYADAALFALLALGLLVRPPGARPPVEDHA
jgi:DHA1 family multidrug resistance protein-like MFS transporter